MRVLLLGLLLAVCLSSVTATARAEDRQLQVLALASPDAYENARALTGALRRAILRRKGWTLGSGEYSLEVLTAALDCPEIPDEGCLARISDKVGSERFIWGTLTKRGDEEVEAELTLWQKRGGNKQASVRYSSNLSDETDDALLAKANEALDKLLGAATGTLRVAAGSIDGELMVDGKAAGEVRDGKAEVEVPTGKLDVVVEAKGYKPMRGTVVVEAGGSASLVFTPSATKPGASGKASEAEAEDKPSILATQSLWGWVAIGAGAAAVAAGSAFWVHSYTQTKDDDFERYVNQTPSSEDPCDRARNEGNQNIVDLCDANVTSRTMALVMIPVGAVLGGLGTYLVLSDDDDGSQERGPEGRGPRVRPLVAFGPSSGRLDLQMSF